MTFSAGTLFNFVGEGVGSWLGLSDPVLSATALSTAPFSDSAAGEGAWSSRAGLGGDGSAICPPEGCAGGSAGAVAVGAGGGAWTAGAEVVVACLLAFVLRGPAGTRCTALAFVPSGSLLLREDVGVPLRFFLGGGE